MALRLEIVFISLTQMDSAIKPTITDRDFTVASILAPSALVSAEATEEKSEEEQDGDQLKQLSPKMSKSKDEESSEKNNICI